MRAAFFADLDHRLSEIGGIADRLRRRELNRDAARAALLAQMHDIKGCGAPYGVPEATELARSYEQHLSDLPPDSADLAERIIDLIRDFRKITK